MKFVISELKKIWKVCTVVTIAATIAYMWLAYGIQDTYSVFHNIECWSIASQYLGLFYVLLVVGPVCWIIVSERKNNYLIYVLPRVSRKKYITVKWAVSAGMAFLSIFLISFVTLLFVLYVMPDVVPCLPLSEDYSLTNYYKGYYLVNTPLLYGFVLSCWRGIMAALYATLGFTLALFVNNLLVVMVTPFILDLLASYVLGTMGYAWMDTMTAFDPTRVRSEVVSKYTFLFAAAIIIAEIIAVVFYYKIIKREKVFEI